MAFVWGITLQKLCMILVLLVKDTVGREPLLTVWTFLNQEQETTIICRHKISQSILALCALITTTDLLNAVTDSLHVSVDPALQWLTLHIMHLQHSGNIPQKLIYSILDSCNKKVKDQSLDESLCRMICEKCRERGKFIKSHQGLHCTHKLYRVTTSWCWPTTASSHINLQFLLPLSFPFLFYNSWMLQHIHHHSFPGAGGIIPGIPPDMPAFGPNKIY